jgi:hypothetical protein
MNTTLLEQYHNQSTQVKTQIDQFRKSPVQLSKIHKVGRTFLYEGNLVTNSALKDLLNVFSIKNGFLFNDHCLILRMIE